MYLLTNICFTKYFLCVLSLAEHNCPCKPNKTKWDSGCHRPKNIRKYSGTNTTVYSRTDPEIALPLTNVGKIVLYNFVGVGVPIAYYRKVTNGEDVARPACCKLRCLAILRRKGVGSNPETSLQLKSNPTLLQ